MDSIEFARHLRREMTLPERRLWALLRNRGQGYKFRRQVPRGPYVLDFACLERRLVVELDGSQHLDSRHDAARDAWLASHGFRVLRFWNQDVLKHAPAVWDAIASALDSPPLPGGGEDVPQGQVRGTPAARQETPSPPPAAEPLPHRGEAEILQRCEEGA